MLKIIILGCGASQGVPVIGCKCKVCLSHSTYNKRQRSAIIIEKNKSRILVDFGHDIKNQLINAQIEWLDGAILTHDHADHVAGIDNLQIFSVLQKKPFKIYTDAKTGRVIKERYNYLFNNNKLELYLIDFYQELEIKDLKLQFFKQIHSNVPSMGIRVEDFVYSIDVKDFPPRAKKYLHNIKVWLLDCHGYNKSKAHANLEDVLRWREKFNPEQVYLTSMRDAIDYYEIQRILPENVAPAYDGCILNIE